MPNQPTLSRQQLAAFIKDPQTLLGIEALQRQAMQTTPGALDTLTNAAYVVLALTGALTNERVLQGGPGVTIDTATVDVVKVLFNVAAALGYTPARNDEPYVTAVATGGLSAERVLTGGAGVTIDVSAAGLIQVLVNVATALGYTPANAAGQAFSGAVSAPSLTAAGVVHGASLQTDQTPAATVTASDRSIPINCNGTIYYVRLSTTP